MAVLNKLGGVFKSACKHVIHNSSVTDERSADKFDELPK